jgi:hypothetical protein
MCRERTLLRNGICYQELGPRRRQPGWCTVWRRSPEIDHVLPGNGYQYLLSDVTLPRLRQ